MAIALIDEQQTVAPLRVRDAQLAHSHAKAWTLGIAEAGFDGPPFAV